MTTQIEEIRPAIRAAASPEERREIMRRARDAGLLHLIPDAWVHQAVNSYLDAEPVTAAATADTSQEEWEGTSFKNYSATKRKEYMDKGWAMKPDGRFPIADGGDLSNAIKAYGRAKQEDKPAVRRHIIKRARALKLANKIPDSWKATASDSLEETLARRAAEFNAAHPDVHELSVAKLRTVYLRGVSEHSAASISALSPAQWGLARVSTFCRLAAGDPSARTVDADLLRGTS